MPEFRKKPKRLFHILILIGLTIALYANSLAGQFIWDDRSVISSLPDSPAQVFTGTLRVFGVDYGYYRPLSRLSLWLDRALWNTNPFGYHLTNVILHLAGVMVLYYFACLGFGPGYGFITALVFSTLAVHTENVAFISGRMDILAALFIFLSFASYGASAAKRRFWGITMAALFAAMALLAKESAVVYPLLGLIFVMARYPAGQRLGRILDIALAGVVALAVYLLLRLTLAGTVVNAPASPGLLMRLRLVPQTLALYLQLLIAPVNLNARHDLYSTGFVWIRDLALPLVLVLVVSAAAIAFRRRNYFFLLGYLWFLAAVLPVLNIIPLRGAVFAERFLYLPSAGFALMLADLINSVDLKRRVPARLMLLLIMAVNAYCTLKRNPVWHDEKTFFHRMAEQSPHSALARHNLGYAYYRDGDLARAETEYRQAIKINPLYPEPHASLGDVYYRTGRLAEALKEYEIYLMLYPDAPNRRSAQQRMANIRAQLSDQR